MLLYILSMVETAEERSIVTELFLAHGKLMKSTAKAILQSDALADDAVSDAFVKLITYLQKIKIEEIDSHKTRNLMVIISRHAAYNILNDENKQKCVNIDDVSESKLVPTQYNDNIEDLLSVSAVKSAIEQMPERYRDILLLKVYHGLSDKEIALHLNISHSAVRKRIQRARVVLYELLEKGELL